MVSRGSLSASLGDDPNDSTGQIALDLVEQLHGLDETDDLADDDES